MTSADRGDFEKRVPAGRAARRAVRRARSLSHPAVAGPPMLVPDGEALRWVCPLPGAPVAAPLDEDQALRLARDLGGALHAAHARRLTAGSLDLAQVRKSGAGYVVAGLGSGLGGDPRDDVRELGRVLYQALTGKPPFEVPAEELPARFRPTVLRCLHVDPERRYATPAEMLAALGAPLPPEATQRGGGGRTAVAVAALALLVGAGGLVAWRAFARARPPAQAGPAAAPDAAPDAAVKPVVMIAPFAGDGLSAEQAWLPRGLEEQIAERLGDSARLDVGRAAGASGSEALRASARKAGVDLVVEGAVSAVSGGGLRLEVRLWDARGGAWRLADRRDAADEAAALALGEELAAALLRAAEPAAPGAPPTAAGPGERTAAAPAYRSYVLGLLALDAGDLAVAEAALAMATAADPAFVPAQVALAETLAAQGRLADAVALGRAHAAAAAAAGEPWGTRLAAAAADSEEARLAALEQLRELRPRDVRVALALTAAYRLAGRADACLAEAKRARTLDDPAPGPRRELALCALLAGDVDAAVAAAREHAAVAGDAALELVGDLELARGRYGSARTAWQKASAAGAKVAAVKLLWVPLIAHGKCKDVAAQAAKWAFAIDQRPDDDAQVALELARVWTRASITCGGGGLREAERWAKEHLSAADAESLAIENAALRGQKGSLARARARAEDAAAWPDGALARGARYWPLVAAARAEKQAAAALATVGAPAPADRFLPGGAPLLYEIALAQIDAGDAEAAALACDELRAAAGDWVPALYCQGRAAEAQGRWSAAFGFYRAFLDRWAGADEEHRLMRDVKRRLPRVIAEARKPRPPAPPAPAPAPQP